MSDRNIREAVFKLKRAIREIATQAIGLEKPGFTVIDRYLCDAEDDLFKSLRAEAEDRASSARSAGSLSGRAPLQSYAELADRAVALERAIAYERERVSVTEDAVRAWTDQERGRESPQLESARLKLRAMQGQRDLVVPLLYAELELVHRAINQESLRGR